MKLTKKMINTLKEEYTIKKDETYAGLPEGSFIASFCEGDECYPIDMLGEEYAGCFCHLETQLLTANGGIEYYLVIDKE